MLKYANKFIATLVLSTFDSLLQIFRIRQFQKRFYIENFYENLRRIVWGCLPIAIFTVGASAVVFVIHIAPDFARRGLGGYVGGLIALALVRETVPVMGALAIVTQYSSGMTAQIGSMKVSEQIDALKIEKVNPVSYLLSPMLLAGLFGFPIITLVAILFSITISFFAANALIDTNPTIYLNSIKYAVYLGDLTLALVKAAVFGFVVCAVSYTCGMLTRGGAKAVGRATRFSVVINFALVIILDYIITALWL